MKKIKIPRKNCRYCKGTGLYNHKHSNLYNKPCVCIDNNPLLVPTIPVNIREPVRRLIKSEAYFKNRAERLYKENNTKAVQNVDIDTINSLRLRGFYKEADRLIAEHQRTIKENIKNGKKNNRLIHQSVLRTTRRKNNLCITCGKEKDNNDYSRCNMCNKRHRTYR